MRIEVMNPEDSDTAELERLRRHDELVVTSLIQRFGARVAAVVRGTWRGISDGDVDEVVADVMADAWFNTGEIDLARGSLLTWLTMRARYRTLDRLRSARRADRLLVRLAHLDFGSTSTPEYPSDVDALLADLSPDDRRLVIFRFIEGRPVGEIAGLCGISQKAAEHRISRLRIRLRLLVVATPEEVPSHV
jgi:RNA polymerase sigma factor (sigma-70 family)